MDIHSLEKQAERLREARQARGFKTAREAAERFGFNYNTYSQHERGHAGLTRAAKAYARAFGVSEGWLLTGERELRAPGRVPLMGLAAGAAIGSWRFDSDPIDWLPLPPAFKEADGIYALIVKGNSMSPEHPADALRFVNPKSRPVSGDTVIVQQKIGDTGNVQAFIKRLVRRTEQEITVLQHEPPATIRYPAETVLAIHKVMTVNEMFGI